jgi:carnitine O-acetyltransferase
MTFTIVSKNLGSDRMSNYLQETAEEMRDLMMPTIAAPVDDL